MANTMIPACVQDERNSKVLRIGFVTDETISKMENSKVVMLHNPATGSDENVLAGEYNDTMEVAEIQKSAAGDSVLIQALPKGSTTGANQFLGSKNVKDLAFLTELQDFIEKRHAEMPEGSYTTKLFKGGAAKMCKKVGEETIEAIVEAMNGTNDQFIYECSDMIYHLIVLLTSKGIRIEDLAREQKARHKGKCGIHNAKCIIEDCKGFSIASSISVSSEWQTDYLLATNIYRNEEIITYHIVSYKCDRKRTGSPSCSKDICRFSRTSQCRCGNTDQGCGDGRNGR